MIEKDAKSYYQRNYVELRTAWNDLRERLASRLEPVLGPSVIEADLPDIIDRLRDYVADNVEIGKELRAKNFVRVTLPDGTHTSLDCLPKKRIANYAKSTRNLDVGIESLIERANNNNRIDETFVVGLFDELYEMDVIDVFFARAAVAHAAGRIISQREHEKGTWTSLPFWIANYKQPRHQIRKLRQI
ncbi:MAG: hypothetical protein K2X00_18115 [Nitrospiraceae bacterium]|nr:hypothetical protein [Nitrospiraceae bacterium]